MRRLDVEALRGNIGLGAAATMGAIDDSVLARFEAAIAALVGLYEGIEGDGVTHEHRMGIINSACLGALIALDREYR